MFTLSATHDKRTGNFHGLVLAFCACPDGGAHVVPTLVVIQELIVKSLGRAAVGSLLGARRAFSDRAMLRLMMR